MCLWWNRYELLLKDAPLYSSASSIVLRAVDHKFALTYPGKFDSLCDRNGKEDVSLTAFCDCVERMGLHSQIKDASKRRETIMNDLWKVQDVSKRTVSRDNFLKFCRRFLGDTKAVAVKYMLNEVFD